MHIAVEHQITDDQNLDFAEAALEQLQDCMNIAEHRRALHLRPIIASHSAQPRTDRTPSLTSSTAMEVRQRFCATMQGSKPHPQQETR